MRNLFLFFKTDMFMYAGGGFMNFEWGSDLLISFLSEKKGSLIDENSWSTPYNELSKLLGSYVGALNIYSRVVPDVLKTYFLVLTHAYLP